MNEYQITFLFYVFIYYLLKVGICAACYLVTKLLKKRALQRHEQYKILFMKKRADELERWKVAYGSYDRQKDIPTLEALELPKLVTNQNSFTAYSNASKGYFKFGMSA
ncbi:MAG: hypothetical protein CVU90_14635 [Firmicutes bacterium HGW-Firmicutes-15]|nr:MAG: hypothetical protein CVU90_14635 [Firmicutes bacterium HGW-Firmicutes-15]